MNKVSLTLQSPDIPADMLEDVLEALRPILALITAAEVHITCLEGD